VTSDEWDRRYAVREFVWDTGPNRFVAEELSDLPPGRALDLAAGEGRNAVWLAGRGWQVTAVDFSGVALAPDGTFFVVGHDLDNLSDGVGGPQDSAVLYTPQAIAAELPGLIVKRAGRVHRAVQTEEGARQAIDTLVLAVRPSTD
jgi:SAM-dependent methyltransferase